MSNGVGDTLKDIPEFFEAEIGESIKARTLALAACRDLGPPDLCHLIKANSKAAVPESGSYHFVIGLDASSSATLAAYINSLTYLMEIPHGWFSKVPVWRVRLGLYCCYNAFSRVDVRVEVSIPGGVEAYAVDGLSAYSADGRTKKIPIKEEYWAETYVSAVLRSLHYSDEIAYRVDGLRYFNVIPDLDNEVRFFEAVEQLFWKGYLLGTEADLQLANNVHNYLSDGVMKYLANSGRYHAGINAFAKHILFSYYQEILGVQALCDGLEARPFSFSLLLVQVDFLVAKGRLDKAVTLARRAVNVAPSEFRTWIKLAEIYVELKNYRQALLTLNSCPMFAVVERELPKMPVPARSHFPPRPEAILAYGLTQDLDRQEEATSALERLPGNFLRGTFSRAYQLLTLIVFKVGWDELLRSRSSTFVMEEEYRMQKFRDDKPPPPYNKLTVGASAEPANEPSEPLKEPTTELATGGTRERDRPPALNEGPESAASEPLPTIPVEEDSPVTSDFAEGASKAPPKTADPGAAEELASKMSDISLKDYPAAASIRPTPVGSPSMSPEPTAFHHKRLCERWLDNLFMVLYEDLRTFTAWREEMAASRAQRHAFRYSGSEWEVLGDLCLRLHRQGEAREAYASCVQTKFSPRAWAYLLERSTLEDDLQRTMTSLIRLAMYYEKIYSSCQIPSQVMRSIKRLVEAHGLGKVQNVLLSLDLNPEVVKVIDRYIALAKAFKMKGTLET
ncbi:bud site selection protein [Massospora cicadina]|nr:bud site selection protein [Massospora cicadina]